MFNQWLTGRSASMTGGSVPVSYVCTESYSNLAECNMRSAHWLGLAVGDILENPSTSNIVHRSFHMCEVFWVDDMNQFCRQELLVLNHPCSNLSIFSRFECGLSCAHKSEPYSVRNQWPHDGACVKLHIVLSVFERAICVPIYLSGGIVVSMFGRFDRL